LEIGNCEEEAASSASSEATYQIEETRISTGKELKVCLFVCLAGQGVTSSSCPWQQKENKTLPVPCVTSSSCPWQQKENKTLPIPCVTSSSCPWQQKEKKTLPVPCVTSSSCPWQQKENSKQGRAGAG
jgi:hypothetical protein